MESKNNIFKWYGSHINSLAPLIISFWIIITALLNSFIPQLEEMIADKTGPFFLNLILLVNPAGLSLQKMARDFHNPDDSGLTNILGR